MTGKKIVCEFNNFSTRFEAIQVKQLTGKGFKQFILYRKSPEQFGIFFFLSYGKFLKFLPKSWRDFFTSSRKLTGKESEQSCFYQKSPKQYRKKHLLKDY